MCTGTHPFIPAPLTARVRLVYSANGQVVENVFHWKGDVPWTSSSIATLVDAVALNWNDSVRNELPGAVVLQYVEGTGLDTDAGPQVTLPVGTGGALAGTILPNNVTIAIKFSTGLAGRSMRGRMYWPGLTEPEITGNQLNATPAANKVTRITSFFDEVETATGFTHVIVSYCSAHVWRTTAVVTPVITYLLTDTNLDSQRRRLTGRGI